MELYEYPKVFTFTDRPLDYYKAVDPEGINTLLLQIFRKYKKEHVFTAIAEDAMNAAHYNALLISHVSPKHLNDLYDKIGIPDKEWSFYVTDEQAMQWLLTYILLAVQEGMEYDDRHARCLQVASKTFPEMVELVNKNFADQIEGQKFHTPLVCSPVKPTVINMPILCDKYKDLIIGYYEEILGFYNNQEDQIRFVKLCPLLRDQSKELLNRIKNGTYLCKKNNKVATSHKSPQAYTEEQESQWTEQIEKLKKELQQWSGMAKDTSMKYEKIRAENEQLHDEIVQLRSKEANYARLEELYHAAKNEQNKSAVDKETQAEIELYKQRAEKAEEELKALYQERATDDKKRELWIDPQQLIMCAENAYIEIEYARGIAYALQQILLASDCETSSARIDLLRRVNQIETNHKKNVGKRNLEESMPREFVQNKYVENQIGTVEKGATGVIKNSK